MLKTTLKTFYPIIMGLLLAVSISAGAAEDGNLNDTVELKNGDKIAGTFLNDTLTVSTAYSVVTLDRDKISEISITPEGKDHDVIVLKAGGLVEGTIDELDFSFRPVSGEDISLEKEQCIKITLKGGKE